MESECESEMNRQMLRRNKELEDCIKFQRETIQDQAMRIEVTIKIKRISGIISSHSRFLAKALTFKRGLKNKELSILGLELNKTCKVKYE